MIRLTAACSDGVLLMLSYLRKYGNSSVFLVFRPVVQAGKMTVPRESNFGHDFGTEKDEGRREEYVMYVCVCMHTRAPIGGDL